MDLKGDYKTKARIAKQVRAFAGTLRDEATVAGTLPTKHKEALVAPGQVVEAYAEASRKSYAAEVLDFLADRLEVEAKLGRYPKLKCQICGGDAHVCYPRHLEGRSCG